MTFFFVYIAVIIVVAVFRDINKQKPTTRKDKVKSNLSRTTNPIPPMIAQALEHMELGFQQSEEETERTFFRLPVQLRDIRIEMVIVFRWSFRAK